MKSVDVVGEDKAARMLHGMGRRALDQSNAMRQAGRSTQRSISGIPVATGRLERGTRGGPESTLDVDATGYVIGTKVPYARFVFYGTKYMRARPPKVPSNAGSDAARLINHDVVR
jgi:hypothetical protein